MAAASSEAPPIAGDVEDAIDSTHPAPVDAQASKMFRFSAYIHVGPGAQECEHREDGKCEETDHFHAWVRLPNKFQHRDLFSRASAAKARRLRQLADPESDAREILESDIDGFRGDAYVETMIDDLLKTEWAADYVTAIKEVGEREEYEHIEADRERFVELSDAEGEKPEDEQSEEFRELVKHINQWSIDVKAAMEGLQEPKRQALRDLDREQLIDAMRQRRISQIGDQTYLHVYNQWEWFICTMKVRRDSARGWPCERYWETMGTIEDPKPGSMWAESPEVIDALQKTFDELERALQSGVQGNS